MDQQKKELTYHLLTKHYLQEAQRGRDEFVWLAVQMMQEQLLGTATITDIAAALNMSLANFSLRFKQSMGISPNKYLTNLKLSYAKKELQHSHKNVTEIAFDLGYENISYFIGLFKEKYGLTPKQFTKQLKEI